MNDKKRQLTIKAAYRRKAAQSPPDEVCEALETEIEELKKQLAEIQSEVFEAERQALKTTQPARPLKLKTDGEPKGAVYLSRGEEMSEELRLLRRVTGVEVAEYDAKRSCCVLYHMQHDSATPVKHGLRIHMDSGMNLVWKYSLPLGFNFEAVMSEYDNVMDPECLGAFHTSLVAYYDRQEQYTALAKVVPYEVKMFRVADTSHVELRLHVFRRRREGEGEEVVEVSLDLDYRVFDVRAKQITVDADMPEEEMRELNEQCAVFQKKPMNVAFDKCFMQQRGPWEYYTIKHDILATRSEPEFLTPTPKRPKQKEPRRKRAAGSDDDSYLPDDIFPSSNK